jgi:hypothetical protein
MQYSKEAVKKFMKALKTFEAECGTSPQVENEHDGQIIIYTGMFEVNTGKGYVHYDEPQDEEG